MEYRQLGRSGLQVSSLALGTMTFGGRGWAEAVGSTNVEGARRQIDICLDAGVNIIDTADVYSEGLAEEVLGEALGQKRDDVLIVSKARMKMYDGPNGGGLSRHHILRACEASLRRLDMDHIDIYLLHEWDGLTPVEETLSALEHLVQQGKVRYVGVSNFAAWQIMKGLGIAERDRLPRFVCQQIYYSLQGREAENELIPAAIDQGLGTMVWSPLAGGLLSGKYTRGVEPPEGTRLFAGWSEPPVYFEDQLYDIIDELRAIASDRGVSVAQVALAWTMQQPGITSVVIGARTEEQLVDNLGAANLALSAEEVGRLDKVSERPLPYPHWHQANCARGDSRLSEADRSLLGRHLAE